MKPRTIWKVARPAGSQEAVSLKDASGLTVGYVLGYWTRAPVGGLLCFPSRSLARRFAWLYGRARPGEKVAVYKGAGQHPVPLPDRYLVDSRLSYREARRLWDGVSVAKGIAWPMGTVAYRHIKLITRDA
jgi:hypothetical protein